MRTIVVLYDQNHNEERAPSFACDSSDLKICFYPLPANEVRRQVLATPNKDLTVLIHGADQFENWVREVRKKGARVIDYSSGDRSYERMWEDIHNAKNCRELVERLEYWIAHYTIDPIRRIKHRAMNLFAPLDTDCQYLLELWERGEYDTARRHLEDLQRDWQGEPPYSNSPVSKLARLWYLLVGNKMQWPHFVKLKMQWPHFVKLGCVNICFSCGSVSVESPEKVVSLPEGGEEKEKKGLCLHQWLQKVGKDKGTEWENMLQTAGLKCSNQGFEPMTEAGIYQFVVELQKRLIQGSLPDLRPDTPMQGFENCSTAEANFKQFRNWLHDLNEAFEALVEELGDQITMKAEGEGS